MEMGIKEKRYPGQRTDQMSDRERKNRLLARRAAAEGMVLLENDGVLPLKSGAKLALFGEGARRTIKGGTGSGDVNSRDWVTVEQGLKAAGFEMVNGRDLDALDAAYAEAYKAWEKAIYEAAGPEKDPGGTSIRHFGVRLQGGTLCVLFCGSAEKLCHICTVSGCFKDVFVRFCH